MQVQSGVFGRQIDRGPRVSQWRGCDIYCDSHLQFVVAEREAGGAEL